MEEGYHWAFIPYGKNNFQLGDIIEEKYDVFKIKKYKVVKIDKNYAYAEGIDQDNNPVNRKFKVTFEKSNVSTGTDVLWFLREVPFVKWQDSSKYTVKRKEKINYEE